MREIKYPTAPRVLELSVSHCATIKLMLNP